MGYVPRIFAIAFSACLFLASCTQQIVEIQVSIGHEDMSCLGGLEARIAAGQRVIYESQVIPYNERVDLVVAPFGSVPSGTQVDVEAWCYHKDGSEAGYSQYAGPWVSGPGGAVLVLISSKPRFSEECSALTECRGRSPFLIPY